MSNSTKPPLQAAVDQLCDQVATQFALLPQSEWAPRLHHELDVLAEQALQNQVPIACKAGCSACCHSKVEAGPAELSQLAHWIRHQLSPADLQAFVIALKQAAAQTSTVWNQRQPYLFLNQNQCSIYPLRPASCRKAHSLNVQACNEAATTVPQHYATVLVAEAWIRGAQQGAARVGFNEQPQELNAGLAALLGTVE